MGRIAQWLGLETRAGALTATDPAATSLTVPSRTVWNLSLDRALTLPTVYRAISILATTAAQLPLVSVSPTPLTRRPDATLSRGRFVKRTIVGLAGTGNAYWQVLRAPGGGVVSVRVLNPLGVHYSDHPATGVRTWYHRDNRRTETITAADLVHLRLLEVPGHVYGLGPIQAARATISGGLDLRDYASGWFTDSAVPSGVLSTTEHLTPADATMYRERWHSQNARHDIAILGKGLTYNPILLSPKDAQFLESQSFSVSDIARLFGVPASYLLAETSGSNITYQNLEMVDTQFVRTTLMAYLVEIEDALTDIAGTSISFALEEFLRPDAKTRAEIDVAFVNAQVLTPEEARQRQGIK